MNSSNNLTGAFHLLIIASFLLSLSACGYKASPYYLPDAPDEDKNVEFILQDKTHSEIDNDTNGSCETK